MLLAAVPPELLAAWKQWDIVEPGYLGSLILWWPVDAWMRLALLAWLLQSLRPERPLRRPRRALASAINAEALLSLRSGVLGLLGLLPALTLLAWAGVGAAGVRVGILLLAGLGLLPAVAYFLRRSLAPGALLLQPLRGAEALDWSRDRLARGLGHFLRMALPWWCLGLALDGLSLGLGESGAWWAQALGWSLAVPSLLAAALPVAVAVTDDAWA